MDKDKFKNFHNEYYPKLFLNTKTQEKRLVNDRRY
jgi:hypothetical protein